MPAFQARTSEPCGASSHAKPAQDEITAGRPFVVREHGTSKEWTFVIEPDPDAASGAATVITSQSPLGVAFLGRNAGQLVVVKTPRGEKLYIVVDVGRNAER